MFRLADIKRFTWEDSHVGEFLPKGLRSNISYESSPLTRSTCNCSSYASMGGRGISVLRNVITTVVPSNISDSEVFKLITRFFCL